MKTSNLEDIFRALNKEKIRYLLVGGLAVVAHGYVRLTMDVDIVIDLEEKNLLKALLILKKLGFKPRVPVKIEDFANASERNRWIQEKGMLVFPVTSSKYPEIPMDIFVSIPFDFDEEFKLAERFSVSATLKVPVIRLQQLLKMKKDANRDKDRLDIAELTKNKSS